MVKKRIKNSFLFFFKQLIIIIGISVGFSLLLFFLLYKFKPTSKEKEILIQTPTKGLGLGQCHWIGGPFSSNGGVKWGYSSSTNFDFTGGKGDSWAAVEPQKGVFQFDQIRGEVSHVKSLGKKIMLEIQAFGRTNKEHNIPKWALDEGVNAVITSGCGDPNISRNKSTIPWNDPSSSFGLKNSVKPLWNNPQFVDQTEATLLTSSGAVTNDLNSVSSVRFITKNPVVWDPKFRELFGNALRAMKREFQTDINDGTIEAIKIMSGGNDGECTFAIKCYPWDKNCIPDVINSSCPIIQSMAKFIQKQFYPELSVELVARDVIAKRSNCDSNNVIPGNKVQLCTQTDQSKCPTGEKGSACYVFDDYYIQAVKEMIRTYVEIFTPTPVVWQQGNGLSGTGRVASVLQTWMNNTYINNIWFKFNGWGSRDPSFWSRGFKNYANVGAHGYEPESPGNFSKDYYKNNAQAWCNTYLSKVCKNDTACLLSECKTTPIDTDSVGRRATVLAVKGGIVEDKSSYLCMQEAFFLDPASDSDGDGLKENKYYFNPTDNDPNCSSSEINVNDYGYGFCPGFLNSVMQSNIPSFPNGTVSPSPTTTPLATPLLGDVNGDRFVNSDDAKYVFAHWGGKPEYNSSMILTILNNWSK